MNKIFRLIFIALLLAIGVSLLYNIYALFFPIDTALEADAAEHLHAAYLLSIGERPYLDFIQNHPMLFHHFLVWVEKSFDITSTRQLAAVGRATIFTHFALCIAAFCLWISEESKKRPKGFMWAAILIAAWAMLDIYNPDFHWMWDLRPDFICYGLTLLGLYLIYRWIKQPSDASSVSVLLLAVLGGIFIGFGNAVIPKGIPFIAAFLMTAFIVVLLKGKDALCSWANRKRIQVLLTISAVIFLSFIAGMFLDCHLSHIPVRKWIAAVFLLNSQKHIIFSNTESSPISHILSILGIPIPLTFALLVWSLWELASLGKRESLKNGRTSAWLFSIFTILVNLILPTYSNGVTWSYYFIPAVFSAAAICLLLILRLRDLFINHSNYRLLETASVAAILVSCAILFQILNAPLHSFSQISARKAASREVAKLSPSDFLNEEILPKNLIYLGYPHTMPVKSRNWGYYFMLAHSTDFWKDCHALGLGPDPVKEWENGFSCTPPDAITLTRPGELSQFVFAVKKCQGIDISWIQDEIREQYVLMTRPGASMYFLKDLVPILKTVGWRTGTNKPPS